MLTTNEWILDLARSYHMCPNRSCLTSLDVTNSGIVLIGNNHACEKNDIEVVQLKLNDESIRELTNI